MPGIRPARLGWLVLASTLACASSRTPPVGLPHNANLEPAICADLSTADTVWTVPDLDSPLHVHAIQPPRYPEALRLNRQNGKVQFAFVVQPGGRVDPCSLILQSATNPAFVPPARASVLATQYDPPLRHGVPVYVRVTQSIAFRVGS